MAKRPVSGTKEWSDTSVNVMEGCSNGCWYCYAKATACSRAKTNTQDGWTEERPNLKRVKKNYGKREGTIMFPTAHDLTVGNISYTLPTLMKLLEPGNKVLVVSKPDPVVIGQFCKSLAGYEEQVLWRFTIGSMDPGTLALWEPNAPTFAERLYSLMLAHGSGWQTSVSMEPMLDCHEVPVRQAVSTMLPYVTDAIWLGKMNKVSMRLKINGAPRAVILEAQALEAAWDDAAILELYDLLKDDPKVRWKDSIKEIVGIERSMEAGLDR